MTGQRLPDGFAVQVDRRVRVLGSGSVLLGGSPMRMLRLAPAAQSMIGNGRLEVRDAQSAQLARTLLDATVAHPRPPCGPSYRDVTVVIPVRDNLTGVQRLVHSLRGLAVVVVDDGSARPVQVEDFAGANCAVRVIHRPESGGPAAARNAGMALCETEFVVFLDSDVVPRRGWLEALLGHFCDPAVALVAPRIVGMPDADNLLARYEAVRSSLDLGQREAPVMPHGSVSYVPSAAMVGRTEALRSIGGFDEAMTCGEDVDLCWRLVEAGARLRYEPIALVSHDHRSDPGQWLRRKAFYGSSAGPLAQRHPGKVAPLVISGWALLSWLLLAIGGRLGVLGSLLCAAVAGGKVSRALRSPETGAREVALLTARSLGSAALQLCAAICRHYWPLALLGALLSPRMRRAVLIAAVIDGVADWLAHRSAGEDADEVRPVGIIAYLMIKRLDDLAYGAGLWESVVRGRTVAPLQPQIRF